MTESKAHYVRQIFCRPCYRFVFWVMLVFSSGAFSHSSLELVVFGQEPSATKNDDSKLEADRDKNEKPLPRMMQLFAVDPDGNPIRNARIFANIGTEGNVENQTVFTDEFGVTSIELPPSKIRLMRIWATRESYVPLFAQWWPEKQEDGHLIPDVFTFEMPKGTEIGGVIRDEKGQPISGVRVEVQLREKGSAGDLIAKRLRFSSWLASGDGAQITKADGRWSINNVPAGENVEVDIKLSHPDYIDDKRWGDQQRQQGIKMEWFRDQTATIVMSRGTPITGLVVDPDDNPIANAIVIWHDSPYWNRGTQVQAGPDGEFETKRLPNAKYPITIIAPGWMPLKTEIEVTNNMEPVTLKLQPGKRLRIKFVDNQGKPVPEVYVRIERWKGGESLYNSRHSDIFPTEIPRNANGEGIYEWNWAPNDAVRYMFYKSGYAEGEVELIADGSDQIQVIHPKLKAEGTVADAETDQQIDEFTAVPVIYFRPDFPSVSRRDAVQSKDGKFNFEFERGDVDHALRIEAAGYRTQLLGPWRFGDTIPKLNVKMEPAPPMQGVVLDTKGQPLGGASVLIGTFSEHLDVQDNNEEFDDGNRYVTTDDQGRFSFPAEFEPYMLIVIGEKGFADAFRSPNEQPGALQLRSWARVEGRLLQSRKPLAKRRVSIRPNWPRYHPLPRVAYYLSATTGEGGKFLFAKVPPFKCSIESRFRSDFSPRLLSRQSIPLDLQPGESVKLRIGGEGVVVSGRIVVEGLGNRKAELVDSRSYLLRMIDGIGMPEFLNLDSQFRWQDGWIESMDYSDRARAFLHSLHHYAVQLTEDGQFAISGVPEGDYQFAIRLHETQGFIDFVAKPVIKFRVTADDVLKRKLDLGDVVVKARERLPLRKTVPDFQVHATNGQEIIGADLQGKFTVLHFWYAGNNDCVVALPELRKLHAEFGDERGKLQLLSLSLNRSKSSAQAQISKHALPWKQVLLGHWSESDIPVDFRVTKVPTYFLVSPEGKLLHTGSDVQQLVNEVGRAIGND